VRPLNWLFFSTAVCDFNTEDGVFSAEKGEYEPATEGGVLSTQICPPWARTPDDRRPIPTPDLLANRLTASE